MNKTIKDKVLKIICEYSIYVTPTENTKLEELELDSLSFIEMLVKIEDYLDITFSDEELDYYKYDTIKDIIDKVSDKKK